MSSSLLFAASRGRSVTTSSIIPIQLLCWGRWHPNRLSIDLKSFSLSPVSSKWRLWDNVRPFSFNNRYLFVLQKPPSLLFVECQKKRENIIFHFSFQHDILNLFYCLGIFSIPNEWYSQSCILISTLYNIEKQILNRTEVDQVKKTCTECFTDLGKLKLLMVVWFLARADLHYCRSCL